MSHPLAESLRESSHQLRARSDLLLLAADELDRLCEENRALHRSIDALCDENEELRRGS